MFDDEILLEEILLRDCSKYLSLMRRLYKKGIKRPLLRGSAEVFTDLKRINFKARAKTMNMEERDHQIANSWFYDKFGIKARTDTLFVTTRISMAKHYGTPHYVFPIGGFEVIHSPVISDLFLSMGTHSKYEVARSFGIEHDEIKNINDYKEAKKFFDELYLNDNDTYTRIVSTILEKGNYQKNDFAGAFESGNEIMLKCKAFYMISTDNERVYEFINSFVWDDIYYGN